MAQSNADPYSASGRSAALPARAHMKQIALERSIHDAAELEIRAQGLLARSGRNRVMASIAIAASVLLTLVLGMVALNAHDGTYEGALAGNWAMLGFVVAIGGLSIALSWRSSQSRLRETGQRLMRRAGFQRKLAMLQLSEIEHATLR